MIKINTLQVANYKSLINTNITQMGDINMFFGHNNSGKSNVFSFLETIFRKKVYSTPVNVEDELGGNEANSLLESRDFWDGYIYDVPFIFNNNKTEVPITFEVTLHIDKSEIDDHEILSENSITINDDINDINIIGEFQDSGNSSVKFELLKVELNSITIYEKQDGIDKYFNGSAVLTGTHFEKILRKLNNLVTYIDADRVFTKENINSNYTFLSSKNLKNWLFKLYINASQYSEFIDLQNFIQKFEFTSTAKDTLTRDYLKTFPFEANTNISFSHFESELEVMFSNGENRLPLKNYGSGIQQFFYILVRIFNSNSPIIILEEIELNLSPLLQIQLLKFLKSLKEEGIYHQLLFSSHSPTLTASGINMIDVVHEVTINKIASGTAIESHDDISASVQNFEVPQSFFTYFYNVE